MGIVQACFHHIFRRTPDVPARIDSQSVNVTVVEEQVTCCAGVRKQHVRKLD